MSFPCCEPRRLEVLKRHGTANAIEFVEVLDRTAPPLAPRQRTLFVRLLRPGFTLTPGNLTITGGERIPSVGVLWCAPADALPPEAEPGLVNGVDDLSRTLVVRTDSAGDFSLYTLALVAGPGAVEHPPGFDPKLSRIAFSFKVECPADFDCGARAVCPPAARPRPDIDYLAKDFESFRRLLLDRLSLLVPGWTERSEADLGIVLVELLAYAADNLSYRQDVNASEAYIGTARRRVSVRRHARLTGYFMHEGTNARAFVHVALGVPDLLLPARSVLLTRSVGLPVEVTADDPRLAGALASGAQVFETVNARTLVQTQNELFFYTWGDSGCCLPRGATRATLAGHVTGLAVGDFLLFEEVTSPTTLAAADADPTHRVVVRLTEVRFEQDPSGQLFGPSAVDGPDDVTEIAWDAADALPFPLCLSVKEQSGLVISVARGNLVLVDHGRTVAGEFLGQVPLPTASVAPSLATPGCSRPARAPIPPRFRPALRHAPLTHGFDLAELLAVPVVEGNAWWPASSLIGLDPREAIPRVTALEGLLNGVPEAWAPRRDLLDSAANAAEFVVEVEDDGRARLRFGDDANGKRPDPQTEFTATYRVGNGALGNVGAEAIAHVVTSSPGAITGIFNPLPAAGGVEPEDVEVVRRDAPEAFRRQERAVTPEDYADAAERRPDVQRAAAVFRWTGSWYTAFVSADRYGGAPVDARFKAALRDGLERFRMAGYDLEIREPLHVPLDIVLHVCVKPGYFAADVKQAVRRVLSRDVLSDGTLGVFHPDRFSFGDAVYLSPIVAAAQSVDGVDSVRAERFQRLVGPSPTSLHEGVIRIGPLEVAELADDPNLPECGRLTVDVRGAA